MTVRLREKYYKEVVPALMEEFKFTSIMQVPRLVKIVVNVGVGEAVQNAKAIEAAVNDVAAITGQKPVVTRAKKSVASFKLRAGMPIGVMATLRGDRMYDFFDRLCSLALPRIRDFRGVSRSSFDGRGNYSIGLKEQIVFPDIDYDKIDKIRGLEVAIVTSAPNDEQAYSLLKRLGMPFRD
ncbi:MAG: 50S ribosomal protein L5 [Chloroflexus aggregans]|uniref:Large ribosomal subunit protein uL5 n=1 Tax=Chloroflexus aggregans TaxID=152260 RepID=A0A2J6X2W9_9CHLR|nr:MAG: 50S ribosomal protein L5 [Chloroflexus aggregans]